MKSCENPTFTQGKNSQQTNNREDFSQLNFNNLEKFYITHNTEKLDFYT